MRLLCLNIWGGREFGPLMRLLEQRSQDVDVFCFQEVYHTPTERNVSETVRTNILTEMSATLEHFEHYFSSTIEDSRFNIPVTYGLATFVRASMPIQSSEVVWVYPGRDNGAGRGHPRIVQRVRIQHDGHHLSIFNFHGLVLDVPDPKLDSPERLEQSRKVRAALDEVKGEKILCGDFNLRPDTESLRILEIGMVNLVKTRDISTTRSPLYTGSEKHSDYVLVSPGIQVNHFEMLPDIVSDHLPLVLDFSL